MSQLKQCPCGETPESLSTEISSTSKWGFVYGDCCAEWNVEFRTGYYNPGTEAYLMRATDAWNGAKRDE